MSLPWFRLYHELKDDPKMGLLDDAAFRTFIECLCWACDTDRDGDTGLTVTTAKWALRRDVTVTLQVCTQVGILSVSEGGQIFVTNWKKRQMMSDSSAERTKKYREKRKVTLHVTSQKRPCDAIEENRIDKNRIETPPSGVQGGGVLPLSEQSTNIIRTSPVNPTDFERVRDELCSLYGKKPGTMTINDQDALQGVMRRDGVLDEWEKLKALRVRKGPQYFPHTIAKLLGDWDGAVQKSNIPDAPKINPYTKQPVKPEPTLDEKLAKLQRECDEIVAKNKFVCDGGDLDDYRSKV